MKDGSSDALLVKSDVEKPQEITVLSMSKIEDLSIRGQGINSLMEPVALHFAAHMS